MLLRSSLPVARRACPCQGPKPSLPFAGRAVRVAAFNARDTQEERICSTSAPSTPSAPEARATQTVERWAPASSASGGNAALTGGIALAAAFAVGLAVLDPALGERDGRVVVGVNQHERLL
jgi:hypothetical protein